MNWFRELVLYMLSQMDDEFKKQNEAYINSMFLQYPILFLMKDDLVGYAEQRYKDNESLTNMIKYIECLDANEMQHVANKLVSEPMMDSFWMSVECWLNGISDKILKAESV